MQDVNKVAFEKLCAARDINVSEQFSKNYALRDILKFLKAVFEKLCAARDVDLKSVFKKTIRCARYEQNFNNVQLACPPNFKGCAMS